MTLSYFLEDGQKAKLQGHVGLGPSEFDAIQQFVRPCYELPSVSFECNQRSFKRAYVCECRTGLVLGRASKSPSLCRLSSSVLLVGSNVRPFLC